MVTCPVTTLRTYLAITGLKSGRIFRGLRGAKPIGDVELAR